jgi:hypothetical protein
VCGCSGDPTLIADFEAKGFRLGKPQVMRLCRPRPATSLHKSIRAFSP